MIELRWLTRAGRNLTLESKMLSENSKERVLQSRVIMNHEEIGIQAPIWSEWEDVPEDVEYEGL